MNYQWNIFLASLDPARGSEQAGKRPVLVVSRERINQVLPVVNVIPLTSVKSPHRVVYPNEVLLPDDANGLAMQSIDCAIKCERWTKHVWKNIWVKSLTQR